ncbi:oligosaccharide flippase family protein [Aliivibrio fischeri]|uniref:oligosaccharide flippase family protein n=1 Tax=Aliivibrio fischeri TaxID=668 RepID=UPI00080E3DE5|nr:oligosaccharide flippase family protein [Aliivibrio fischeri]OCH05715.1 hypothetical protein A6E11_01720 [Aliivibrio fischeri]
MFNLIFNFAIYRVVNLFFPLVTIPIMSYYTSQQVIGQLFILQAYAFWVSLIVDFGFIRTGVVDYLKSDGKEQTVFNEIISSQLLFIGLVFTILMIILVYSNIGFFEVLFIFITGVAQGLVPKWLYQAEGRMLGLSIRESLSKIIALLLLVIFLPKFNDLNFILFVYVIMAFSLSFLVFFDYSGVFFKFQISNFENVKKRILNSLDVFKMRLVGNGYLNLNIIILSMLSTPEVVSIYGICERLAKAMTSVLTSVGEALFPISVNREENQLFNDLKWSILTSFFPTVIMLCFPNFIISFLISEEIHLGNERLIFLAPVLFSLSSVFSLGYVTAKGKYKIDLYIQIVILLFSMVGTFVLFLILGHDYPFYSFLLSSFLSFLIYAIYTIYHVRFKCFL